MPRSSRTRASTESKHKHYALTAELETGNELIDSEHKALLDAINDLLDACEHGSGRKNMRETAKFLSDYVVQHFSDEEQLQKQHNYPRYHAHRAFHIKYIERVKRLVDDMHRNGATIHNLAELNEAAGIIVNHIQTMDKRLAAFIRGEAEEADEH